MKKFHLPFFLAITFQCLYSLSMFGQTEVRLNFPNSGTWYPPVGCTSFYVEVWGAGAGGSLGFAGGGGSFAKSIVYTVTAATRASGYAYTVGASGSYNNDGMNSSFSNCIANGGVANGGARKKATIGGEVNLSYYGGNGAEGIATFYGGGGGSAYTTANGNDGTTGALFVYGTGGAGTGNGGNSGENGAVPGGGGSGGGSGAVGQIRIWYTCSNSAGTIGNAHTVPYPRQLAAGADVISNTLDATAFPGLVYNWQQSTDNTNWSAATGSTNATTYAIPEVITNTYFRRVTNNSCGTANSNTILITVFNDTNVNNGAPSKNGAITGFVRSRNGTGVAGITVKAQKSVSLKGSPQSYIDSVITDVNGKYQFSNLFYGDKNAPSLDPSPVNFTITPSKTNHKFNPPNYAPLPLSYNAYNEAVGPVFKDTTVLAITGKVYQQCEGCLNINNVAVNTITLGIDSAKITGGDLPAYADNIGTGNYGTTVQEPGDRSFTPSYKNHQFNPSFISETINDNVADRNFMDTTTRAISGKLTAGAGDAIGSAVLEFSDTVKGRLTSTFRKRVTTASTGEYAIRLPARAYKVKVISFTSSYPDNTNPRYIAEGDVVSFFNTLLPKDSLYRNVDTNNAVLNLVYHRKPVLQITGLIDTACNPNIGVVFKQNIAKNFTVNVFEGDPVIGFNVVTLDNIQNADSLSTGDSIRIWTDLLDQTGTAPPAYIPYRLTAGKRDVALTAGVPNISAPFDRKFQLFYKDRYGRDAVTIVRNTVTVGIQAPPQTFVTVAPEIPQLILHRPPGDQSYSFWEQTKTVETSQRMSVAKEGSVAAYEEVKVGAEFSAGIGVEVVTKVEGSINASINTSVTNNSENELTFSNSTTTKYSTKAGGITGSAGDVYIGGAMNYKYGISNVVAFNDGCVVGLSEKLIIAPKGFATTFTYSEDHVVNTLMPTLEYFVANTSNAQKSYYENQLNVWQQVIQNNKYQKEQAKFVENRSFDGSAGGVEVSKTFSKSAVNTIEFNLAVEKAVALKIGAEVNGTGVEGGVTIGVKTETGSSNSATQSTQTTTGFYLGDQNAGDYYSVDIKEDRVYGTPVFALVAGTSSCPPEPGAQSRDNPRIIIDNPVVSNIPVTGKGFFTIKVVNQSESRETRDYQLSLNNATSNGVTIRKGGVALGGSDIIPIGSLAYLEARDVLISVEKDNPSDKIFSYPNIEFVLTDACSGDVMQTNSITANFVTPCGGIVLDEPATDWVNTSANNNFLPVTFSGYTLSGVDSVTLQYARAGTNNWIKGFTLAQFQITNPTSTTVPWNVSGLADTTYKLRLRMVCSGGNNIFTTSVNGVLDRKAPFLIGQPQPADNNYVNGDDISFSYNENINTGGLTAANVEITRLSNNSLLQASVSGFGNKIQIVPLSNMADYPGDSVRVIVKNIADVYGNVKTTPDTSYFIIGTAVVAPGVMPVKLYTVKPAMFENGSGMMEVHFKIPSNATRITKINFTISGSALLGSDYNVSSDTLKIIRNVNSILKDTSQVYNYYNGATGYINIGVGANEAILKISPLNDQQTEGDESIRISLASGGDYTLQDSTTAVLAILDPVSITADGPVILCNGSSVNLSASAAGNALQFDGTDDYVDPNKLPTIADNFTVEAWVNPSATHQIDAESPNGFSGTSGQRYLLWPTNRKTEAGVGISVGTNGVSVYEHGNSYMPALLVWEGNITGWTHIAVVYINKQPSLYINGNLVKTGIVSTRAHCYPSLGFGENEPGQRGGIGGGTYGYYQGSVDEFRIWSSARSAIDIQKYKDSMVNAASPGLMAYYRLNESTGIIAADATSNGNAATLLNGPVWTASAAPVKYAGYLWSPGNATTASIAATAGTYTVKVTDANGNSSVSAPLQLTIGGSATVNAGTALLNICPNVATIALGGSFGGDATGAIWSDGGLGGTFTNNTGSTPQTATYTPSINANGNIAITLTTQGACSISANKSVFVNGQSTWLGISNDWRLGSNWSNGVVPISCTKVIIPSSLPFMPTITGTDNTCYKLSLQPGANITVGTGAKLLIIGKN